MIWLLIGYLFLAIYRPMEIWPVLGSIRIELLYAMLAGSIWLVNPHKRLSGNSLHCTLLAFALGALVCCVTSRWMDRCLDSLDAYFKFLVIYLMLVSVVRDEVSLKRILWAFTLFMCLYMLHSFWEFMHGRYISRMGIQRMVGVDSTRNDPNTFATTLTYALLFVPVLYRHTALSGRRAFLIGFTLLAVACILLTGSRSGLVGLVLLGMAVAWQSKYRMRAGMLMACVVPVVMLMMSDQLLNRFETIFNPAAGPANAQQSSETRIEGLLTGLNLFFKNPLTGVGPGAYRPATGSLLESHNLYGQVLGETGLAGTLPFAALLVAFLVNLRSIRRAYREHPEWGHDFAYHLTGAVSIGVFLMLVKGNFGHNLFSYNWAFFAALLAISRALVKQRLSEEAMHAWDEEETWDSDQQSAVSDQPYELALR